MEDSKKKTVGIITFHFVNNFGGALQAYALQKAVQDNCGVFCRMIDYRNCFIRFTDMVRLFPISGNLKELAAGLKTMPHRIRRVRKFSEFAQRYYKRTRTYSSCVSMRFFPPKCDKYICGSDQIWNPTLTAGVSPNYFLTFVKQSQDKIAYAPSFGTDRIPGIYKRRLRKYLRGFDALSVREKSGRQLIYDLTGRKAVQLIDPVFLLDRESWETLGKQDLVCGKYILLYIMQRDDAVFQYAKRLKERFGIPLVEISRYGYKPDFVDRTLVDVGPEEFLGLFRDAAYICTNSYHGLVYSIVFEKEFCLIPCKRFRARIDSLLELLDLQIESAEDLNHSTLIVSYDKKKVCKVIEKERRKAFRYLNGNLNGKLMKIRGKYD